MKRIEVAEVYPFGVPRSYINSDGELVLEVEAYIDDVEEPVLVKINLGDDPSEWRAFAEAATRPQKLQ